MDTVWQVLCVVGARPNFMKIAPIMDALGRCDRLRGRLLHTGQHYDAAMKQQIFDQLGIPSPEFDLGVGSGSHAFQTAEVMKKFEPVLDEVAPDLVLVVGDVNSTLACALVAAKKGIAVAHVEAGLRSFDRSMPEEVNRVLTDQISDLLFTTERSAQVNLVREGVNPACIHFVGNVMIDTLKKSMQRATPSEQTLRDAPEVFARKQEFGVVTLHRPANVDNPVVLTELARTLIEIANRIPLVFPMHPRTKARIVDLGLMHLVESENIYCMAPLGYLDLLGLLKKARVVFTDSGGIQEETTALGVPCLTLRENTERPITVSQGTNTVVGMNHENIYGAFDVVMATGGKTGRIPEYWDGAAAGRIVDVIEKWMIEKQRVANGMVSLNPSVTQCKNGMREPVGGMAVV